MASLSIPPAYNKILIAVDNSSKVAKRISDISKQVQHNRHAIRDLGDLCQDQQNELVAQLMLVIQAKHLAPDSTHAQVSAIIAQELSNLLTRVEHDIMGWCRYGYWQRIQGADQVAKTVKQYHDDVLKAARALKEALIQHSLDTGKETLRLARLSYDRADAVRDNQAQLQNLKDGFDESQRLDYYELRDFVESTTRTIENLQGQQELDMSRDSTATNLMEDPQSVISGLRDLNLSHTVSRKSSDNSVGVSGLLKAIELHGDKPLWSIDSSTLTTPISGNRSGHRGANSWVYPSMRNGKKVAIKRMNMEANAEAKVVKRIIHEADMWQGLNHPNIVPFLGICNPNNVEVPLLISAWMPNGNARVYARSLQADADCFKIFLDIVDGLIYLQTREPKIIHGGLKASTVLIDQDGTARLTDFALSAIEAENPTGSRPPSMRWSSPEILDGHNASSKSDIYSFASTMYEIITDDEPFSHINHVYFLHRKIREGLRPEFPENQLAWARGLTSTLSPLWRLMQAAWQARPEARPDANQCRIVLKEISDLKRGQAAK